MKFAVAFLAVVAFAYGDVQLGHRMEEVQINPRIFESAINKSAECIRNLLVNGDESLGLPSLDPIEIDDLDVDLDQYGWDHFKGQASLSNFKVQGQLGWHISELKVSPTILPIGAKITVKIDWSDVNFGGDYKLNANILDHSIEGSGAIAGAASEFSLKVVAQGSLSRVSIKKLDITPTLKDISFSVGELVVDGRDVSESVNSKVNGALDWVQENLDTIGDVIAEAILSMLQKKTRDANLDGIIGAITDCIQL